MKKKIRVINIMLSFIVIFSMCFPYEIHAYTTGVHSAGTVINGINVSGKTYYEFNFNGATHNTGSEQQFVSPGGPLLLEVWGGSTNVFFGTTGKGGYVYGQYNSANGEILRVYIGGKGVKGYKPGYPDGFVPGGWNGGGGNYVGYMSSSYSSGHSGAGATDIRVGGTSLGNRIIVAGGAGGNGGSTDEIGSLRAGGNGGGLNGNDGQGGNYGGGGGSQSAGGLGGQNGSSSGQAGTLGQGGNGGSRSSDKEGGGGGGGYYGGGGGATEKYNGGGGGGGSSYIGGVINGGIEAGVWTNGNGKARITILNTIPKITINIPSADQSINGSGTITISGTVTDPDPSQTITVSATLAGITKKTTVATPASNKAWTLNWSGSEIPQGKHTDNITVTADDGQWGTASAVYTGDMTVDKTVPTISSMNTSSTANSITVSCAAQDNMGLHTAPYRFSINNNTPTNWTANASHVFYSLSPSQNYTIKVEARDALGNIASQTQSIYTKNNYSPEILETSPNQNQIFSETNTAFIPKITVKDRENESVTCKYYLDSETSPRDTKTISNTTVQQEVSFNPLNMNTLAEGAHTLKFEASDGQNVPIVSMVNFKVDKTPPTIGTITTTSKTSSITVSGSGTDHISGLHAYPYRYTIGSNVSPWTANTSYTQESLLPGTAYTVTFEARDALGHIASKSQSVYTDVELGVSLSKPVDNEEIYKGDSLVIAGIVKGPNTGKTITVQYALTYISPLENTAPVNPLAQPVKSGVISTNTSNGTEQILKNIHIALGQNIPEGIYRLEVFATDDGGSTSETVTRSIRVLMPQNLNGEIIYIYNDNGELVQSTTNGTTTDYNYNNNGSLTKKSSQ